MRECFEWLRVEDGRKVVLNKHLATPLVERCEPQTIGFDTPKRDFTIRYANATSIEGRYQGISSRPSTPKHAVVWVGGFTEQKTGMRPHFLRHKWADDAVVQFSYTVSQPVEFTTLSRYADDMRAVLRYVNSQVNLILPNKIILITRSINGFIAAAVAAEDEFHSMLAGVILIAPVFDFVEMIDQYRQRRNGANITLEKLWRLDPEVLDLAKWDQTAGQDGLWVEFFNQKTSLALIADIVRQEDTSYFRLSRFVDCVGRVSERCPVYVFSNPDDPVTGSKKAIEALQRAASGGGKITSQNFEHIPIKSKHLVDVGTYGYPWSEWKAEVREIEPKLRQIYKTFGVL